MVYISTFIVANSFLNIIAAAQDTEMRYQSSSNVNAVISVLVFRMHFVCTVNRGAAVLNMSDFVIFETDTQSGALELFSLLKYYSL